MKNFITEESAMNALMLYGYPGFLSKSKQKRMKLLRLCVRLISMLLLTSRSAMVSTRPKCRAISQRKRLEEMSARFDPQSEEWRQIWVDKENERKEKEDKKKELERKRAEREEMIKEKS